MEISPRDFRVMMFYDLKRELTYEQSHRNLVNAFDKEAPALSTVSKWFREFSRGRDHFEDDPRSGRPKETVTPENIRVVKQLIKEHRNITYHEIQETLGVGASTVNLI